MAHNLESFGEICELFDSACFRGKVFSFFFYVRVCLLASSLDSIACKGVRERGGSLIDNIDCAQNSGLAQPPSCAVKDNSQGRPCTIYFNC